MAPSAREALFLLPGAWLPAPGYRLIFRRVGIQGDPDFIKAHLLDGDDLLHANQFQQRQEKPDDLAAGLSAFENLPERHGPVAVQPVEYVLGVKFDRRIVIDYLVLLWRLSDRVHDLLEGVEEVPYLHIFQIDFLLVGVFDFDGPAGCFRAWICAAASRSPAMSLNALY